MQTALAPVCCPVVTGLWSVISIPVRSSWHSREPGVTAVEIFLRLGEPITGTSRSSKTRLSPRKPHCNSGRSFSILGTILNSECLSSILRARRLAESPQSDRHEKSNSPSNCCSEDIKFLEILSSPERLEEWSF